MSFNKIIQTSAHKVNGKSVRYKQGDCFSIDCENRHFLGAFVFEKFNKYYDLTLIEYYKNSQPDIADFVYGNFFGTRFGSWQNLTFAADKKMVECKYVDKNIRIQLVGNIKLVADLRNASYSYSNDVSELLEYYLSEISIRLEKLKTTKKFPDLAFVSQHLVSMKEITKLS